MTAALWCKSNGSFLEGASHPEELVDQAIEFGLRHLAITDRDGVYGSVRAHMAARSTDLHLIHGAQVTLDDQSSILLLVRDQTGWANLCSLLTKGRLRCPKGQSRVSWDEVCLHAGGLFALWGGRESLLVGEADRRNDAFASGQRSGNWRPWPRSRCSTTTPPGASCRTF
jgi:error-prone DNA polymerase